MDCSLKEKQLSLFSMQEQVRITEEESRNIISENKSQKERIN